MNLKTVTVLGANGAMGCGIAAVFARAGARVYMVCRTEEKANAAVQHACTLAKAEPGVLDLIPVSGGAATDACVSASDLVFESVAETYEAKREVLSRAAASLRPDAVLASGTSGLSIARLASFLPAAARPRFLGMHFFNPPLNLKLLELIPCADTERALTDALGAYAASMLGRAVVEVRDAPGFLANRIGFQFINRALQACERYAARGGVDYVDAVIGRFSGRNMPPVMTADYVGLDIHSAIVKNLYENTCDYAHETFALPEYARKLLCAGRLGRKTNGGLYISQKLPDGTRKTDVYDVASGTYRPARAYDFAFAEAMTAQLAAGEHRAAFRALAEDSSQEGLLLVRALIEYVVYALFVGREVSDIAAADRAMAAGFGWAPPLAVVEAFGGEAAFRALAQERLCAPDAAAADALLNGLPKSEYDYTQFFKIKAR